MNHMEHDRRTLRKTHSRLQLRHQVASPTSTTQGIRNVSAMRSRPRASTVETRDPSSNQHGFLEPCRQRLFHLPRQPSPGNAAVAGEEPLQRLASDARFGAQRPRRRDGRSQADHGISLFFRECRARSSIVSCRCPHSPGRPLRDPRPTGSVSRPISVPRSARPSEAAHHRPAQNGPVSPNGAWDTRFGSQRSHDIRPDNGLYTARDSPRCPAGVFTTHEP